MFTTRTLLPGVFVITGVTGEHMYLIEGRNSACLVDTGIGYGDLAAFVHSLTKLPVTVLLTHGHLDHTGGSFAFQRVYIHSNDIPLFYQSYSVDAAWEYIAAICSQNRLTKLNRDLLQTQSPMELIPYKNRQRFDLGRRTVSILPCFGHTPGSVCILLEEDRKLIIGDACNNATYLFFDYSLPVHLYKENLLALYSQDHMWDRLLFSHYDPEGEKTLLDEVITLCDRIQNGQSDCVPYNFMGNSALIAAAVNDTFDFRRLDGKEGNLLYNPSRL